jgi:hypothetical protein
MKKIQKDEKQKEEREERRGTSDAMKVLSLPNYIYIIGLFLFFFRDTLILLLAFQSRTNET